MFQICLEHVETCFKRAQIRSQHNKTCTAHAFQTSTSSQQVIPGWMKTVSILNIPHVRYSFKVVHITKKVVKHRLAPILPEVPAPQEVCLWRLDESLVQLRRQLHEVCFPLPDVSHLVFLQVQSRYKYFQTLSLSSTHYLFLTY